VTSSGKITWLRALVFLCCVPFETWLEFCSVVGIFIWLENIHWYDIMIASLWLKAHSCMKVVFGYFSIYCPVISKYQLVLKTMSLVEGKGGVKADLTGICLKKQYRV
jgi:hypothetical protein